PETVFRLRVGGALSTYGVSVPLEVWQSADERLVLAVTCDGVSEEREGARVCGLAMAPSPMVDDGGMAAEVTSLSFEFSQHALSQVMEKWQLMQLVKAGGNVYHLLVNAGATIHVLVFHVWKRRRGSPVAAAAAAPRGLGISYFSEKGWYYPPVFPIKFRKTTEYRLHDVASDRSCTAGVECICQHLFDAEQFLGEFLETFKPLRQCSLVDYDLRLVRVKFDGCSS
ncbi:hypothetical protein PHYSODRAFT_478104, partial [Phytophthora sojae]